MGQVTSNLNFSICAQLKFKCDIHDTLAKDTLI